MNTRLLLFISLIFLIKSVSFTQNTDYNIGASIGIIPEKENGLYLGEELDYWPDRETTLVYGLSVDRNLTKNFRVGVFTELERTEFEEWYVGRQYITRWVTGSFWLGQFPDTKLKAQLGGFFDFGIIAGEEFDTMTGIDMGMIAGPALDLGAVEIAIHVHAGLGYFWSDSDPEDVLLPLPKIFLKIGYNL